MFTTRINPGQPGDTKLRVLLKNEESRAADETDIDPVCPDENRIFFGEWRYNSWIL